MKISIFSILLIFLCIVVIFSSITMSCTSYKPNSPEMMYSGNFPYTNEGFRSNDYSTVDNSKSVGNSCNNVNGFNGLLCAPEDSKQNPNEIFSKVKGDTVCKSYGYTNSRGNLCLNEEQIKLLSTRGGNA